jgi:hypothetical protein
MITIPAACEDGTCQHADFPHMLVTTAEYDANMGRKRGWMHIPSFEFIVCLTCHHWPESGTRHTKGVRCRCGCHFVVLDSRDEASTKDAADDLERTGT